VPHEFAPVPSLKDLDFLVSKLGMSSRFIWQVESDRRFEAAAAGRMRPSAETLILLYYRAARLKTCFCPRRQRPLFRVPILIYKLGRLFQFIALILLPIAIAGNVADRIDLRDSLLLSTVGCGVFMLGWLMQQSSRPR
jgi:hypothetical protein